MPEKKNHDDLFCAFCSLGIATQPAEPPEPDMRLPSQWANNHPRVRRRPFLLHRRHM
jgi:hypothetical protein